MTTASEARSGKGERDENFPVASRLLHARLRPPILAFYRFVRAADDIADHADLVPAQKLQLLGHLGGALHGDGTDPEAEPLRRELAARGLSPKHALDLLSAFRQDVRKTRYADWSELMGYCALSAMPVGRFVLDVHGESPRVWPVSDRLCAALQVVNHLQDCADDYRNLDRVYLPLDCLDRHGARVEDLARPEATPAMLAAIRDLAARTAALLDSTPPLSALVADRRLSLEIAAIERMAAVLVRRLRTRDPLRDEARLGRLGLAFAGLGGVAAGFLRQLLGRPHVVRGEPA
jgi:squalene synthase HpnC